MNKNLQTLYTYHNETKHSHARYARSLGYMDWETQPNPYRNYQNTKKTLLPLAFENNTLPYHLIFDKKQETISPLCLESISQFFQFSLGLAAIKKSGSQEWALRCNASSGNLQPSEAYIISDEIPGIPDGLHHYDVQNHSLELLSSSNKKTPLEKDSFLIAISSIVWREAWKYGERSWRYTQLDCGHAFRALQISAFILGWKVTSVNCKEEELSSLIGLNQENRYIKEERENPDMLLCVSRSEIKDELKINEIRNNFQDIYEGKANQLSKAWQEWPILKLIEDTCKKEILQIPKQEEKENKIREATYSSKEIVLKRRSAQVMNAEDAKIKFTDFEKIIGSVSGTLDENKTAINLVFFIHDVEGLDSGLYVFLRDITYKEKLQEAFDENFLWQEINNNAGDLYLLKKGDYKNTAKTISCSQDIAKDSSFSIAMLADFSHQINTYGPHRYKELYWECGAIGQQLYLEATSLNLNATGIGCFLDDLVHTLLGIKNLEYQSLYHFTIGRALFDSRITTLKPYSTR